MKKLLSIILCVLMLCSLSACVDTDTPSKETSKNQEPSNSQKQETNTPEKKDETFGIGDTAAFNELKFTANELKESKGDDFFTPEDGKTFVGIKFTIENVSNEEQSISSLLQFEAYANDVKCDYSVSAACVFDEGTLDGSVAPGKKLVGWYALEVPSDWSSIEIDVLPSLFSNNTAKFVFAK